MTTCRHVFRSAVLLALIAALGGCDTALGHRMGLAKDGLFMRLRGKKPSNAYRAHYNLERNLDAEQEKRLFLYRYYPDYYEGGVERSMEATGSPQQEVPMPAPMPMPMPMQAQPYASPPMGMGAPSPYGMAPPGGGGYSADDLFE